MPKNDSSTISMFFVEDGELKENAIEPVQGKVYMLKEHGPMEFYEKHVWGYYAMFRPSGQVYLADPCQIVRPCTKQDLIITYKEWKTLDIEFKKRSLQCLKEWVESF